MLKVLNEEEKDSSWLKLFNEGKCSKVCYTYVAQAVFG